MVPRTVKKFKLRFICGAVLLFFVLNYFGVFTHLYEKDFYKDFHYPYDGDLKPLIQQLRHHMKPDVNPINFYNYSFVSHCERKCKDDRSNFVNPRLVYIVKSAADNFERRKAIRNSWGYERRFSDVLIKTVFILGTRPDSELQERITKEYQKYKDIVQADFHDVYFNNTIKTMVGFKWAHNYCPFSKFYIFADDDMYISTKNVLRFIRNPTNYPDYLLEPVYALKRSDRTKRQINNDKKRSNCKRTRRYIQSVDTKYVPKNTNKFQSILLNKSIITKTIANPNLKVEKTIERSKRTSGTITNHTTIYKNSTISIRSKRQVFDFELPDDVRLFSGYVFVSSPHRHKSSKWYITLDEYPYDMWPPYVTGGAFVLSREALLDMYYASFYTKHFRFDDVYLGLLAFKSGIEPYHCEEFHFYKKEYSIFSYHFVIASHGYGEPNELLRIWNEQRSAGNA